MNKILSILFILFPFVLLKGQENYIPGNSSIQLTISAVKLDANQISTWFKNNAEFNNDPITWSAGFEWPIGSGSTARYSGGLWIGAVLNNDTFTSCVHYGVSDFTNGYIDEFGNSQGFNDLNYRIYKIYKGDSLSSDYINWPVYQGAFTDNMGRPYFLGTQTMFYVFNDNFIRNSGNTSDSSLKAQILQTNWAYNQSGYLENVIFTEYRIINRSNKVWNDFYFGLWNDDDAIGEFWKVATDTIRNMGFTYNNPQLSSPRPVVGNLFLRGLLKFTGDINDSVKYYNPPGSNNLIIKTGYKDLKLRISNRFNNSMPPSEPINNTQTYRVITGRLRDGTVWINPVTNAPTTFVNTGDPVTGTGWIQAPIAYKRTFQGTGPATVNPGDTVSVLYAQLVAMGTDNLNSITKLRETADFVKQIYDENFQSVVSVHNASTEVPEQFSLSQNYPNPFNPATVINYSIPSNLRGQTSDVKLIVYNILGNEVKTLVNEKQNAGSYSIEFDAANLASGIYFYKLEAGEFRQTKRMILLK